jgi:hypothetical protein
MDQYSSAWLIFAVLASHWVGDYILQALFKGMAVAKGKYTLVAISHCLFYMACYVPTCLLFCKQWGFLSLFVIGVTHFLEDRFQFPLKPWIKRFKDPTWNDPNWFPVLYVVVDNGYHLLINLLSVLVVLELAF